MDELKERSENMSELWIQILNEIPESHRDLLELLFGYFYELSLNAEYNKMSCKEKNKFLAENLSKVMAMGGMILQSKEESENMENFVTVSHFLKEGIINYKRYF